MQHGTKNAKMGSKRVDQELQRLFVGKWRADQKSKKLTSIQ